MLLRFVIRNFLSFYETTSFDMFPNNKRTKFANHIYTEDEIPLLKVAAIYGANGSGKSNFIKAFDFLRGFVTKGDYLSSLEFGLDEYFFQLAAKPSEVIFFQIEFLYQKKYYLYDVDIRKNGVSEKLSRSGLGKQENIVLFERKGTEITSPTLPMQDAVRQLLSQNPHTSLLYLNNQFPILNSEDAQNAYKWFNEQTEVITINSIVPRLIQLLNNDKKILKFTNQVFSEIGLGIKSLDVKTTSFDDWIKHNKNADELERIVNNDTSSDNLNIARMQNNRNILDISTQNAERRVTELLFNQIGQEGYNKQMNIRAPSDGTVRLLLLMPALYDALYKGKIIFIDEIDNSIHPALIYNLLHLYGVTQGNGQLIFTTHSTILLNQQELLRPDEIWFTEKEEGNSLMYSLNDYKIHHTIDIERGYLDGRYGGVPIFHKTDDADEL